MANSQSFADLAKQLSETFGLWQPIETAPQDGSFILLYRPDAPDWARVAIGSYNDQHGNKKPKPYWELHFRWSNIIMCRNWQPTHWMPRPQAPNK